MPRRPGVAPEIFDGPVCEMLGFTDATSNSGAAADDCMPGAATAPIQARMANATNGIESAPFIGGPHFKYGL